MRTLPRTSASPTSKWALAGFSVGRRLPAGDFNLALGALALMAALGGAGLWRFGRGLTGARWGARAGA